MLHMATFHSSACHDSERPVDSELSTLAELPDTRNSGDEFKCGSQTTVVQHSLLARLFRLFWPLIVEKLITASSCQKNEIIL